MMGRTVFGGAWVGCLAAAFAVACGDEEQTTARGRAEPEEPSLEPVAERPRVDRPRSEPTPRLGAARERCELALLRSLAPTVPPGRPEGTRVAVAAHRDLATSLVAIDGSAEGDTVELSWPDGDSDSVSHGAFLHDLEHAELFALEMTGPDAAVLVRAAACVSDERAASCLYVRGIRIDREGAAPPFVTAAETIAMPGPPSTMRLAASDGRVLLARSHVGAGPALDVLSFDGQTLEVTRRPLGEGIDPERGPVEILALAATAASHAVVYRQGAQEADDSTVTLATSLDEHAVPELSEALVVESVALFSGAVVMVVAFEFSEPSWLRLGMDGEILGPARPLPAGEEVPIPFTDRRVARVDGSPPSTIEIRDGAGHATAPRLTLPGTTRSADLARVEGGFLVATLEADDVRISTLRCRSQDPAPEDAPDDDNGVSAR